MYRIQTTHANSNLSSRTSGQQDSSNRTDLGGPTLNKGRSPLVWSAALETEMWDLRHQLSRQMFEAATRCTSQQLEQLISASRKRLSHLEFIRRGAKK